MMDDLLMGEPHTMSNCDSCIEVVVQFQRVWVILWVTVRMVREGVHLSFVWPTQGSVVIPRRSRPPIVLPEHEWNIQMSWLVGWTTCHSYSVGRVEHVVGSYRPHREIHHVAQLERVYPTNRTV